MSFKLIDRVKKTKGVPRRLKGVLEAYLSFAHKDGTEMRPSKKAVADRAGCSKWTVFRATGELHELGVLVYALDAKGNPRFHLYGTHWVPVYNFGGLEILQNADYSRYEGNSGSRTLIDMPCCHRLQIATCDEQSTGSNKLPVMSSKKIPIQVAKCDATIPYDPRPSDSPNFHPSVVTTTGKQVSELASRLSEPQEEKEKPEEALSSEAEEKKNQPQEKPEPALEPLYSEVTERFIGEEEVMEQLRACFPSFKSRAVPTLTEKRLMQELIAKCDGYCMFPYEAMDYARKHKQATPALIPRSVKGLHAAICGEASSTNGLAAQTKEHDPGECLICKKELAALPCARCNGNTWGKPVIEHGRPFCTDCMKLPAYRRMPAMIT